MRFFDIRTRFLDVAMSWDWRWFGFELSVNNHDKYINVCFTWLQIIIYFGRVK
jgi:hypothetical protein